MECQNRTPLDTIESRLSNIERRVYGKSNPSFREKEDAASEVIICNGFVFQLVSHFQSSFQKVSNHNFYQTLQVAGGVVPRLTDIAKDVGNAVGTRERAAPIFRRLKELESYMDPSFGESKGNQCLPFFN